MSQTNKPHPVYVDGKTAKDNIHVVMDRITT